MVHPRRQCGEEGATAPLQPQEAERIWPVNQNPDKLLQMYNREHPVGLNHSLILQLHRPQPARQSIGWCGLHNASPWANYLPSMTPTAPDVTGRPKRLSRTITTQAIACSHRYHPEGEVSTGASKLGPRD
jgi:hypothetical protein